MGEEDTMSVSKGRACVDVEDELEVVESTSIPGSCVVSYMETPSSGDASGTVGAAEAAAVEGVVLVLTKGEDREEDTSPMLVEEEGEWWWWWWCWC